MSGNSAGAPGAWQPSTDEVEDFAKVLRDEASVPGYRADALLGRGGQGAVFRARQESTGRTVALKIIRREQVSVPAFERFRRERDLICLLQHPNIVTVFDAGVWQDRQYLAMELVDGPTLNEWLATAASSLNREALVRLLLPLCDGMAYAHRQGVIHRDLKPQNVLMQASSSDGEGWLPKIADFGLARNLEGSDPHFATMRERDRLSTLAYSAPELLAEGVARPDTRTDVFGLGAILYRMLARRDPRHGLTIQEMRATSGPAPYASIAHTLAAGRPIGRDLEAICCQAMAPDPEARYATVNELADDLRRFLDGRPVRAVPRKWSYVLGKSLTRNRAAWTLGAIAVGIGAMGLGAWIVQSSQTREQEQRVAAARARHASSMNSFVDRLLEPTRKALGSNAAVLEVARDLVREQEEMLREDPDNAELIAGLVGFRQRVGDLLMAEGRPREALTEFEEARRLLLAHFDPSDPTTAAHANVLLVNTGDAIKQWDPAEGLKIYEAALVDDRARLAAHGQHPAAARFADDLAWSLQRVGGLAFDSASIEERPAVLARVHELHAEFANLYPHLDHDPARANDVALAETMLLLCTLPPYGASAEQHSKTASLIQRLAAQAVENDRDSVHYRRILSTQMLPEAIARLKAGDAEGARPAIREALGSWDALIERSSGSLPIKAQKAFALTTCAMESRGLSELDADRLAWLAEAITLWEEVYAAPDRVGHQVHQHVRVLLQQAIELDGEAPSEQVTGLVARAGEVFASIPATRADVEMHIFRYQFLLKEAEGRATLSYPLTHAFEEFLAALDQLAISAGR
jgi:serine/threonine protein kinase